MDEQQCKWERTLQQLSLLPGWVAIGLLFLCVGGIGFLWFYAISQGFYPHPRAASRMPLWAGNAFLSDAVYHLAFLPMGAVSAALFSAILKPNVRALTVIPLSVICFSIIVAHTGIVDD